MCYDRYVVEAILNHHSEWEDVGVRLDDPAILPD